jgi:hypothetical protein
MKFEHDALLLIVGSWLWYAAFPGFILDAL